MPHGRVAIGVTAHNEGRNIGRLLDRLRALELPEWELLRIVVVASGCTDDTVRIARDHAARDPRVVVAEDPERRGKSVAIQQFIDTSRDADVLVMESADTLPEPGAIAALLRPLADPAVGMVGSHPVPEDDERHLLGYATRLLWRLHHEVASRSPKQGELVAWRNVVTSMPVIAMDEAYLEAVMVRRGLRLVYAPDAIVRNRGPATLEAFITQRRRNHAGHRVLAATEGYRPSTRDKRRLVMLAARELVRRPGRAHWLVAAAAIELWASVLGWWDYAVARREHVLWTSIEGTKRLSAVGDERTATVTAVVVTSGQTGPMRETLAALARGSRPPDRTLIVVRRTGEGTAAAINVGLRLALQDACDHVLLLTGDVLVGPDHVAQALGAAAREPGAASVTGPIFYEDDPERIWYAGAEIVWPIGKAFHRGRRNLFGPAFAEPRRTAYATAAAAFFRAETLREVGEWDESYFAVYDDADWSVRAARRGWVHLYEPRMRAWRSTDAAGEERTARYLYYLLRNNVRFMRKFARPWHWPGFVVFFALESVLRQSLVSLTERDALARERAIWAAVGDALRGRDGARQA